MEQCSILSPNYYYSSFIHFFILFFSSLFVCCFVGSRIKRTIEKMRYNFENKREKNIVNKYSLISLHLPLINKNRRIPSRLFLWFKIQGFIFFPTTMFFSHSRSICSINLLMLTYFSNFIIIFLHRKLLSFSFQEDKFNLM